MIFCFTFSGSLIGPLEGGVFWMCKINNIIGVFHPMNCLMEFPSYKYDLGISIVKGKDSEKNGLLDAQYVVAEASIHKLFKEFVQRLAPSCDNYPKIFHILQTESALNEKIRSTLETHPASTLSQLPSS